MNINTYEVEELESFPPNENPFLHDAVRMGEHLGTNLTIMYANTSEEQCSYLILINRKTGKRIQIKMEV
jgi:hypothetical protein